MQDNALQKFFAYAALFLLPFPALNFGVSFTVADVFLLLALLLNLNDLLRVQAFQIPFLLAVPFFLLSALRDPDGDLTSTVQVLYIWGVVMPFGWCAFTNIAPRRIAYVLLLAATVNSAIAAGQCAQLLPEFANQTVIDSGKTMNRGAGLSLACNALVMQLTPCFLLLPYLRQSSVRLTQLLALVVGMASSLSKATILGIPGILYYFWYEPKKRRVLCMLAAGTMLALATQRQHGIGDFVLRWHAYAQARIEKSADSLANRQELIDFALDWYPECYVTGFGWGGANALMRQVHSNVHVYYVGLMIIAGIPAVTLMLWGFTLLLKGLWQSGEVHFACFLAAHLLACIVMTALVISFQSLPLMVAGAVLVHRQRSVVSAAQPTCSHRSRAMREAA